MKRKITALILSCLLFALCFAGCGSKDYAAMTDSGSSESYYYYSDTNMKSDDMAEPDFAAEDDFITNDMGEITSIAIDSALQSSRKIILYADINIETTEFNDSINELRSAVESLGGYISSANTNIYNQTYSLHSGNYTVRIPSNNFNAFISRSNDMGNVTSTNIWQDDVTSRYTDIETRLATLETKRDRLLSMMEEATEMADIIELENALTDTVYQIEMLTGERKTYDDKIDFSTATLYIREVRDLTKTVTPPKTLGERISQKFSSSIRNFGEFCEDTIVFLVGALPTIIILAIIAFVIILIIRRTAPRRAMRRERAAIAAEEFRAKRNAAIKAASENKNESDTEKDNK